MGILYCAGSNLTAKKQENELWQMKKKNNLYNKYKELADKDEKVIFGGRLGQYKYYDMDKVIDVALTAVKDEFGE